MRVKPASVQFKPATMQSRAATLRFQPASLQSRAAALQVQTATMQVKAVMVRVETATVRVETATMQSRGATLQVEPATMQVETASVQFRGATMQVETASVQFRGATVQSRAATMRFQPASLQFVAVQPRPQKAAALRFSPSAAAFWLPDRFVLRFRARFGSGEGLLVRLHNDALLRFLAVVVNVIFERAVAKAAFEVVLLHLGIGLIGCPPVVRHPVERRHRAGAVAAAVTMDEDRLIGRIVDKF